MIAITPFGLLVERPQLPLVLPIPIAWPPSAAGPDRDLQAIPQLPPAMGLGQGTPAMPQLPFMPFGQQAPDALPLSSQMLSDMQDLLDTLPQPYELYEDALRGSIDFLGSLFAQSEAAHDEDDSEEDAADDDEQDATTDEDASKLTSGKKRQPASPFQPPHTPGMMPRSDFPGNVLGVLFGASDTDYFYED